MARRTPWHRGQLRNVWELEDFPHGSCTRCSVLRPRCLKSRSPQLRPALVSPKIVAHLLLRIRAPTRHGQPKEKTLAEFTVCIRVHYLDLCWNAYALYTKNSGEKNRKGRMDGQTGRQTEQMDTGRGSRRNSHSDDGSSLRAR